MTREIEQEKIRLIIDRFEEILGEFNDDGERRSKEYYDWAANVSSRERAGSYNVGNDVFSAVNLARKAKGNPQEFKRASEYATTLLSKLGKLKISYDRIFEDYDGYGGATFHGIARNLNNYLRTINIFIDPNPYEKEIESHQEKRDYDFEKDIEDSWFCLISCLKGEDYLLAFDFAQIHLLQLASRLYLVLPSITEVEVLLYSKRIKRIQSIILEACFKAGFLTGYKTFLYRYVAGAQALLSFVQNSQIKLHVEESSTSQSLPMTAFGLDYERAIKVAEYNHANPLNVHHYEDSWDKFHSMGYRHISKIEQILDNTGVALLNRMFVDPVEILGKIDDYTILNYVTKDVFDSDWNVLEHGGEIYCFIINPNRSKNHLLDIEIVNIGPYGEIATHINNLPDAIKHAVLSGKDSSGGDLQYSCSILSYNVVQYPRKHAYFSENLIIIPEGIMSLIPYSGLTDAAGAHLSENHNIIIASSFRALCKELESEVIDINEGLIIGNPDFNIGLEASTTGKERFKELPETAQECFEIASLTQWMCFKESEATGENLLQLLPEINALHVATHGFYDGNVEEVSLFNAIEDPDSFFDLGQRIINSAKIALAGANGSTFSTKSLITSDEILSLDLQKLKLCYLSLCMGSIGSTVTGEVLFGMARAFLASGSATVVASLFPVDDTVSKILAIQFYKNLISGYQISEALRMAQIKLKESGVPWYSWAGFQVLV